MDKFIISLLIGTVAGIIDVLPMIFNKMDKASCISAFVHWVILGLIIPFVNWNMQPWMKGLLLGELSAIPIMIIVVFKDPKALIPMIVFSAILGIGVALAGAKFVK